MRTPRATTATAIAIAWGCLLVLPGPNHVSAGDRAVAADAVTLRDGKTILGELVNTPSERGTVLRVRRDWAREHAADWLKRWEATERLTVSRALTQRRSRLLAWRQDRRLALAPQVGGDRISPWIDRELARLENRGALASSPLLTVRIAATDVTKVERHPHAADGYLRQAWVAQLDRPELQTAAALRETLEARGFDMARPPPVSLDGMLPLELETEAVWLTRRAATEVLYDPGLRLVSYSGMLTNDPGLGGEQPRGLPPLQALPALSAILGEAPDPLPARLQTFTTWGKVGATVLRLEIPPDLSAVEVEVTLWVRSSGTRWQPAGSRRARVRPEDLGPGAGKELVQDPQVDMAFKLVEALVLREIGPDIKQRALGIGSALQRALLIARGQAQADLTALAFPVLDRPADPPNSPEAR